MKKAAAILALLCSFHAHAIDVSVRRVTANGERWEALQLVNLLAQYGVNGSAASGTNLKFYQITGSIYKSEVKCLNRQYVYTVEMTEMRQPEAEVGGPPGDGIFQLPTLRQGSPCEEDTAPDKVRTEFNRWGLSRLSESREPVSFRIDCDPIQPNPNKAAYLRCFVEFSDGALGSPRF